MKSIIDWISDNHWLDSDSSEVCQGRYQHSPQHIAQILLQHIADSETCIQTLAEQFSFTFVSELHSAWYAPIEQFNLHKLCLASGAIPIDITASHIELMCCDPFAEHISNWFAFYTQRQVTISLCPPALIQQCLSDLNPQSDAQQDHLEQQLLEQQHLVTEQQGEEQEDTPIAKYLEQIFHQATQSQASDIHFEPHEHYFRIRLRCHGILATQFTPALQLKDRIITRLKLMAELDIAEKRCPQDGKLRVKLADNRTLDMRLSTLPTPWGEKVVLRIIHSDQTILPISALGLSSFQLKQLQSALKIKQGMIIVTGPTGSGKTTSLYAMLAHLNKEEVNIATVEDPIERDIKGITQTQIHPTIGVEFETLLRSLLRQDPDIIMVGEIRDNTTAMTAFHAAQTGHLVLTTLHTNSALATLTRLEQMAIPHYLIASSVKIIIAQRLVRCLCQHCKLRNTSALIGSFRANASGCEHCQKGFNGRAALYELLVISPILQQALEQKTPQSQLEEIASQLGFVPLKQQAQALLENGVTCFSEVESYLTQTDMEEAD